MLFIVTFFYFLLIVLAAACILLPDVRHRMRLVSSTFGRLVCRLAEAVFGAFGDSSKAWRKGAARVFEKTWRYMVLHRWLWCLGTVLIFFPALIGVWLGQHNLTFFDEPERDPDARVALLLQGEQLVPPSPLPPEVFEAPEVEMARPLIREASRNWGSLDEEFSRRLLLVYKIMRERHGYEMTLLEGYRSPERQARLAALGNQVTKADANRSYHQYGLAADSAFLRDGRIVISEKDAWAMEGYRLYGEVAASVGFVWGGNWSFRDYGHVEYRKPGFKLPSS
ncbi:MAG: M15 family metallopeptidase [Acidovorax sp.]|jgi:peptidoglycan L-alanyl-D-glutamate endopeptidase CwlK|nr:M15 family metallopeptidase [Acidovorax sp.]